MIAESDRTVIDNYLRRLRKTAVKKDSQYPIGFYDKRSAKMRESNHAKLMIPERANGGVVSQRSHRVCIRDLKIPLLQFDIALLSPHNPLYVAAFHLFVPYDLGQIVQ